MRGFAAHRHGWTLWQPLGSLLRGRAALGAGRFDEAERELAGSAAEARRCGASGTEHLATLLASQSRLLAGVGTTTASRQGRAEPPADPETDAVTKENRALRELREGHPDRAHDLLRAAAAYWDSLGATVWSARALRMSAETAPRAGNGRARAGLVKRSESLLDALGTPAPARLAIRRMSEDLVGRA